MRLLLEEERKKEEEIQEELKDKPKERWDHADFFYLEACYGLHRLLPRQVQVLAQDWTVQSMPLSIFHLSMSFLSAYYLRFCSS